MTLNAELCLSAHAQQKTRIPKPVPCPQVVADRTTGAFIENPGPRSKVQCFRSPSDAKKNSFLTNKQISKLDFSGWWRFRFTKVVDTCGRFSANSGFVLFVQVVQKDKAVFADFCPLLGQLAGARTKNGISLSRTYVNSEATPKLLCADNSVEVTERVELERIVDGGEAYNAQLIQIRRCPGEEEGARICTTTFTGIAFPETHKIWPAVERNTSQFNRSCNVALARCSECHENLSDPPLDR